MPNRPTTLASKRPAPDGRPGPSARDTARVPGGDIVLRGLTRTYPEAGEERVVLDDVDAEIAAGEFVVIVGRSGSGKSTLLNLISGIDRPTRGAVLVGGTALTDLTETERTLFRRHHIGFIFQFFNLLPTLTVEENLLLPLELIRRRGPEDRARVAELLAAVGLEDRAGAFPDRLSGGEQQRVAVIRALAHDPDIILADEPTGNLDLETGRQVLDLLDRLARRAHKTLIMVTHSPEVVGTSDRTLTIRGGKLVALDPA